MLAYFAMMLVEKHRTCRLIFVDVVALYRAGLRATTVRCYNLLLLLCGGTALPRYAATIPTSLHKSIVPCGGTGLRRYAVPSLLN